MNLQIIKKKYRMMLIILCFSMMPLIAEGYSMYALILLFPCILKFRYDANAVLIILFSLSYVISFYIRNEHLLTSQIFFYLLFPIIAYSCGIIIGNKIRDRESIILIVAFLSLCLAGPAIIFILSDTITSGQLINTTRIVEYKDGINVSATNYGLMLSLAMAGLGTIFIPTYEKFDRVLKYIIFSVSLISLFCAIHILNRSAIALCIISMIVSVLAPPINAKKFIIVIFVGIMGFFFYKYFYESSFMYEALQGYQQREQFTSSASGGDRFNRWGYAIEQIFMHPEGSMGLYWEGSYRYAHNLWLDAGLRGGIIPFILLIGISIKFFSKLLWIYKKRLFTTYEYGYLLSLTVVMFSQAMVEPVIEGLFQFFVYFILYFGILSSLGKREK